MGINYKILALLALMSFALISCEGHRTAVGGVGGAAAGGFLGHALGGGTAGIIGGALAGGLVGGAIGVALSFGVAAAIDRFVLPASVSLPIVFIALTVSVTVGVISGFIPAWRASRLHPIDALHYE